ncbi:MAG TPA: DinB family protein [Candidatus Eisenbacteria bacterium]|nr:DinB family protein [Candidatus Eisenbacteria bacterium]
MAITSPDPVTEAVAYQRSLLDALGDDDPAAAQAQTPARIRALIAEAGDELRTRPEHAEWSVIECIGHVVDAEMVMAGRYRWVLAHDRPELIGYDQDLWVDALRHGAGDPAKLVAVFEALREANLDLWQRSSQAQRDRVGVHRERGPESYELSFRMLAGHDRVHLDQADRALAAVRGSHSGSAG